jgi:hypothetical protein
VGPKTAREADKALTFTQPFDPHLDVNLQVRGPGRMRVLINGKDISAKIGDSLQPQNKLVSFSDYTTVGYGFPLDPATFFDPIGTAGPKTPPGTPVTVTIAAQDFQGPNWRVEVVRQSDNGG